MTSPSIDIVTSINKSGFDAYARDNYNIWTNKISNCRFFCYSEDSLNNIPKQINYRNLYTYSPACKKYIDTYGDIKLPDNGLKAYKVDHRKFCFKVYTLCSHVLNTDADFTIWLDSDVKVKDKKFVNRDTFKRFTDNADMLLHYLNRDNVKKRFRRYNKLSTETGLIIVNNKHHFTKTFVDKYQDMYDSGQIFDIEEQHDGYVFDWVIKHFEQQQKMYFNKMTIGVSETPLRKAFPKLFSHAMGDKKLNGQ